MEGLVLCASLLWQMLGGFMQSIFLFCYVTWLFTSGMLRFIMALLHFWYELVSTASAFDLCLSAAGAGLVLAASRDQQQAPPATAQPEHLVIMLRRRQQQLEE